MRAPRSAYDRFLALTLLMVAIVATFGLFMPFDGENLTLNFTFNERVQRPELRELQSRPFEPGEQFVLSSIYRDEIAYLDMSLGDEAEAPYRFRVLIPGIVRVIVAVERSLLEASVDPNHVLLTRRYILPGLTYWCLNFVTLLGSLWALHRLLGRATQDKTLRYAGLVVFVTQFAVLKTASFPMLDLASYLLFIVGLELLLSKRWFLLGLVLAASVATKEVALLWTPALIAHYTTTKERPLLVLALIPPLLFAAIRAAFGESPLNVQHDWDLAAGELSLDYFLFHTATNFGFVDQLVGMFLAYGFLWIYLPQHAVLDRFELRRFFWVAFAALLGSQLLLSDRIARPLALLLPLFLLIALSFLETSKERKAEA